MKIIKLISQSTALTLVVFGSIWLGYQLHAPLPQTLPTVRWQQEYLNSCGIDRYNCGEVDGVAGTKFCRAINNWTLDQYALPYMVNIKGGE